VQRKYRQAHKKEKSEYNRKYRQAHKKEKSEYNRKYRQAHMEEHAENVKRYRRRYPEKAYVAGVMSNAFKTGKLTKEPCEMCGGDAEAHHEDYDKPLEVRWLCRVHHKELHRRTTCRAKS
jgi:hypothetical protein